MASLVCFLLYLSFVYAQAPVCINSTLVDKSQELPYLTARFPALTWTRPSGNPYLGRQNQTYCCAQAVDEYLGNDCVNSSLVKVNERILESNVEFPCGAEFNGDPLGAPEVAITYGHSKSICPGWTISAADDVNAWAQLLVGFILPAVVFSFNIPRPRKLRFPEKLFSFGTINRVLQTASWLVGLAMTALCMVVDTTAWLSMCFAFAGPLLLSGVYEAQLDKRVIDFLKRNHNLPPALRARIMFTVLCGNLSMYPAWSDSMNLVRHLDEIDRVSGTIFRSSQAHTEVNNGTALQGSNERSKIAATATATATAQSVATQVLSKPMDRTSDPTSPTTKNSLINDSTLANLITVSAPAVPYGRSRSVNKVIVRLKAMLECQYDFSTTIGGPIVFFLGSFIYALLELKGTIGDEDIAQALAFGMWWIVIPHVAIISGLLLAGNNPNILESIVSIRDLRYSVGQSLMKPQERRQTLASLANFSVDGTHISKSRRKQGSQKARALGFLDRVYTGEYEPAWMWDRGRCKQDWLVVLFVDSWLKYQQDGKPVHHVRESLTEFLCDVVMLSSFDWAFLWISAFLLIFIPCLFGFLTAYYTPVIGISCRALTMLVYLIAQTLLLVLWAYHLTLRDKHWVLGLKVKRHLKNTYISKQLEVAIEQLRRQANIDTTKPSRIHHVQPENSRAGSSQEERDEDTSSLSFSSQFLFYTLCTLLTAVSLLTSIGGSLMQTIGVFRNSLCHLTVANWQPSRRNNTFITISRETYADIVQAKRYWLVIGTSSAMFLAATCYVGWWYQRRLRSMFTELADRLEDDGET